METAQQETMADRSGEVAPERYADWPSWSPITDSNFFCRDKQEERCLTLPFLASVWCVGLRC